MVCTCLADQRRRRVPSQPGASPQEIDHHALPEGPTTRPMDRAFSPRTVSGDPFLGRCPRLAWWRAGGALLPPGRGPTAITAWGIAPGNSPTAHPEGQRPVPFRSIRVGSRHGRGLAATAPSRSQEPSGGRGLEYCGHCHATRPYCFPRCASAARIVSSTWSSLRPTSSARKRRTKYPCCCKAASLARSRR